MEKLGDLIRQISDEKLRDELASEGRELKKQKRLELVFKERLPEVLRLPKAVIRLGNVVAHRDSSGSEVWRVIQIPGKKARCRRPINPTKYDQEVLNGTGNEAVISGFNVSDRGIREKVVKTSNNEEIQGLFQRL